MFIYIIFFSVFSIFLIPCPDILKQAAGFSESSFKRAVFPASLPGNAQPFLMGYPVAEGAEKLPLRLMAVLGIA